MKLTGHKTEAVYRRYAMVSSEGLRDAVRRLNRLTVTLPVTPSPAVGQPASGSCRKPREIECGGMAEWSMAVVLKTTEPATVPGVRIPLPPPDSRSNYFI
jgi:hypothetical protein